MKPLKRILSTITRYLKALTDAKVLYECSRFDMKSKRSLSGEKKYYLADLSFYFAQNTDNRIHYGPVLENMVYTYKDNYPKYVATTDSLLQQRNGIKHIKLIDFMKNGQKF